MNDAPQVVADRPEQILVVEDDAALRATLETLLGAAGYVVFAAADGESALRILQRHDIDLVLSDLVMPGMGGEELVRQVRQSYPDVPVIVLTSFGSVASAVALTRSGAAEYLTKPVQMPVLLDAMRRALDDTRSQRERRRATRPAAAHLKGIIGRSRVMRALFDQIARIAPSRAPVLITGETGTGKELIARAVHGASGRDKFVPVNAGAIPPNLLESELFGHVRGAFTGADRDRVGLFEAAHEGTLFLDEIADLPLVLQAKLLRVLQSGELRRVGEVEARHVAVRLIAATHRSLAEMVATREFRADLFYRINVIRLEVPPLRERTTDIPLLAEEFLAAIAGREEQPEKRFAPAALAHLVAYAWPGNVRQLYNTIERMAVLTDHAILDVDDLPPELRGGTAPSSALQRLGQELTLADLEREHILTVLARVGGNRSRAAELLGIPRRTLYRRLKEYGVIGDA
jgi:DNA-binding NtrC family response regulator